MTQPSEPLHVFANTHQPLRIAVVGCGFISDIYFQNLLTFSDVQLVACADLNREQASRAAEKYGVKLVLTPAEAYAHPDIDLILNLTNPAAHAEVSLAALQGGKHVYNEKPLALALTDARRWRVSLPQRDCESAALPIRYWAQVSRPAGNWSRAA